MQKQSANGGPTICQRSRDQRDGANKEHGKAKLVRIAPSENVGNTRDKDCYHPVPIAFANIFGLSGWFGGSS